MGNAETGTELLCGLTGAAWTGSQRRARGLQWGRLMWVVMSTTLRRPVPLPQRVSASGLKTANGDGVFPWGLGSTCTVGSPGGVFSGRVSGTKGVWGARR